MTTHYIKLWHPKLDEAQKTLDSLKFAFRIFRKDPPNLRQVLTLEGSPTADMLDKEMVVSLFLSQFKIEEVSEAERTLAAIEELKKIQSGRKVYREDEMKALEDTRLSQAAV